MQTRRWFLQLAATAVVPYPVQGRALDYSNRPVRVIVPYLAGGTTDIVGRIPAQKLSERLGRQFYVENAGSGGSEIT